MDTSIVGPVQKLDAKLGISPYVEYMLDEPAESDCFWFAIDGSTNTAVGGLKLSLRGGKTARDVIGNSVILDDLSVDQHYLRRGIGTELMYAAEHWLEQQPELPHVMSLGVDTNNAEAIGLYRKLGYKVAERGGELITFLGTDGNACYAMYKALAS